LKVNRKWPLGRTGKQDIKASKWNVENQVKYWECIFPKFLEEKKKKSRREFFYSNGELGK